MIKTYLFLIKFFSNLNFGLFLFFLISFQAQGYTEEPFKKIIVQKGEWFFALVRKHCGDQIDFSKHGVVALLKKKNSHIKNFDQLEVGDEIYVCNREQDDIEKQEPQPILVLPQPPKAVSVQVEKYTDRRDAYFKYSYESVSGNEKLSPLIEGQRGAELKYKKNAIYDFDLTLIFDPNLFIGANFHKSSLKSKGIFADGTEILENDFKLDRYEGYLGIRFDQNWRLNSGAVLGQQLLFLDSREDSLSMLKANLWSSFLELKHTTPFANEILLQASLRYDFIFPTQSPQIKVKPSHKLAAQVSIIKLLTQNIAIGLTSRGSYYTLKTNLADQTQQDISYGVDLLWLAPSSKILDLNY